MLMFTNHPLHTKPVLASTILRISLGHLIIQCSYALSVGGDAAILKKVLLLFYSKLYQLMKVLTHTHTHIAYDVI
jgi:hypothetical protein